MKFTGSKVYSRTQKKRMCLALLLFLVICGVFFGTAAVCTADNLNFYHRLLFTHNIFKTKTDISVFSQFFRSFLPLLMLLMIQFFSGYFAFGQVIAGFTAVYRGMVSGISAAFVYLMLGVSGFFAVLITALPFAAASAAVLILGARESARLSRRIADYSFFGNQDGNNPPDGRLYMLKFAVLILLAFALSLADVLIAYFLGRIFFAV